MPTEVSQFLILTRVYTGLICLGSFNQISSVRNHMTGGNTYNITILSLHTENPQALPRTSVTPGVRAVTLPAMTGGPAPSLCGAAHLSALPCPAQSHSGAAPGRIALTGCGPTNRPSLSMATAATEKPVHLLRK